MDLMEIILGIFAMAVIHLIVFSPYIIFIASLVYGTLLAKKIFKHKPSGARHSLLLTLNIFALIWSGLIISPLAVKYKISEWRLGPSLQIGQDLQSVVSYLDRERIYYKIIDQEYCDAPHMQGYPLCDQGLPLVIVRVPIKPSIIKGTAITQIYFDDVGKVRGHHMKIGWTFL